MTGDCQSSRLLQNIKHFGHEQGTEGYFEIRTYKEKEELIPCDWNCEGIKAFPLKPRTVDNDYPAYIQPGGWEEDYQFVFQISSDEKAGLNIVDSGSFYFFYSKEKNLWDVQYDFY